VRETGERRSAKAARRHARRVAALALISATCGLALATSSAEAASFTWSGAALVPNWSKAKNWGGTAPSGSVETLTFPLLTSAACSEEPPAAPCYFSVNDLSGLSVNALSIDDGGKYFIFGNPITLGAGGLTASTTSSTGFAFLALPLTLGASQTWAIDGNNSRRGIALAESVTGSSSALGIDLSHRGFLVLEEGDLEVGPIVINGGNSSATPFENGALELVSETLSGSANSTDGNPVTVTDAGIFGSGSIGPLTSNGGSVQAGAPEGTLAVAGSVTLDSASTMTFLINKPGSSIGTDYTQLNASGDVSLGGAHLGMATPGTTCPALQVGEVDTLITTSGSLTGTFAGLPDGAIITLRCGMFRIHYTSHTVTVTVYVPSAETGPPAGGGSSPVVPLPAAPPLPPGSTAGNIGVLATMTLAPGAEQLRASLREQLVPSHKNARIGALLKSGGVALAVKALEAGSLAIAWYELPTGARVAAAAKAKPVLVASGRITFSSAGRATIRIKLSSAGKRLLKHASKLALTAKGTFTPAGAAPVAVLRKFTLRR
jgi:hypothetical protein